MSAPVEYKVSAATAGAALASLGMWALQTFVFHGDLPLPVSVAVQTLVPAVVAFAAGWFTKHTPRPDLALDPVDTAADTVEARIDLDDDPAAPGGDEGELPAYRFAWPPSATRYDGPADPPPRPHIQDRD